MSQMSDSTTMLDKLRQQVAGLDPAVQRLLPGYLANRHVTIGELQEALAEGDASVLRRIGHNLKGSGAAYGLPQVSVIGGRIEACALEQDFASLRGLLEEYREIVLALDAVLADAEM
jgi:HPt (histidine-containing phosphotransfer) domain-containing protein